MLAIIGRQHYIRNLREFFTNHLCRRRVTVVKRRAEGRNGNAAFILQELDGFVKVFILRIVVAAVIFRLCM